jgi:hypothetical protein
MMTEEEHGQLKALAWRTLKAVDHIDAKAADEGLTISPEWRMWRSQVRSVIRGDRLDIPNEPPRYLSAYEAHWNATTSGTLGKAATVAPFLDQQTCEPISLEIVHNPRDAEIDALRARIAELEAALATPVLELSSDPPAEALQEAYPDEDHAALKARILAEFASLRNMLIGQIPMTQEQLSRLVALEHPKYQSWLQGVTNGN